MKYYKVYNTKDVSEYYIVHEHDDPNITDNEILRALEILGADLDTIGIDEVELDMREDYE